MRKKFRIVIVNWKIHQKKSFENRAFRNKVIKIMKISFYRYKMIKSTKYVIAIHKKRKKDNAEAVLKR